MLQLSVDKSREEITQQCMEAVGASSWVPGKWGLDANGHLGMAGPSLW